MRIRPTVISKRTIGVTVSILWICFSLSLLLWDIAAQRKEVVTLAVAEARASYHKDLVYRRWSAGHGGTYAPVTENTPPNQYLHHVEERDIRTPSGQRLTLINPAYMTRQVQELSEEQYGIKGHITSLNPIRPANRADDWEHAALISFEQGEKEAIEVSTIDNIPHLRLMRPMLVEDSCLKCHAHQGYKAGDVRGGISVSVPLTDYLAIMQEGVKRDILTHLTILISGLCIIMTMFYFLRKVDRSRDAAMAKIKKQEDHLRTIFSAAQDVAFITTDLGGTDTTVLDFSPGAENIFGYAKGEIVGKEVALLYPPGALKGCDAFQLNFKEKNTGFSGERVLVRKSGEQFPALLTIHPLYSREDEVIGVLAVAIDISVRRKAETALKESEEQARALLNSITESAFLMDQQGRFVLANEVTSSRLGLAGDLTGKCVYDYLPDHVAEPRKKHVSQLLKEKKPQQFVDIRDGMHLDQKISPVFDDEGEVRHIAVFARDITTEKIAEKSLIKDARMNRIVADISRELLSENYDIQTVSDVTLAAAREITNSEHGFVSTIDHTTHDNVGHTLTPMFGQVCRMKDQRAAFPIGDDGKYPALWGHALNSKEPFFTNDPLKHPSSKGLPEGHVALTNYLAVPVLMDDRLLGLIALANTERGYSEEDVSSVRRIAELFALAVHRNDYEKHKEELEGNLRRLHKREAIVALAGGMAHDFNNILMPILGYAEILEEDLPQNGYLHHSAREILHASMRAKELVQQILTFSREQEQELRPLKPHLAVSEAVNLVKGALPSTIEVRLFLDKNCRPIIADPTQIHQVVMNLLTNAYHAMEKDGGVLTVTLQNCEIDDTNTVPDLEAGPYIQLTVKDTGAGMDKETAARIFEPYFTTKPVDKGSGLGMSVVYGIVKNYGGAINVTSNPAKGSEFNIFIPASAAKFNEDAKLVVGEQFRGSERILIVDDDIKVMELERQILERLGYEVTCFDNSTDALREITVHPFTYDLVITDMTMPQMTGDHLTLEIRQINNNLPVIISTGFSQRISKQRAKDIGASELIMKPVSKTDLARSVRKALDDAC